MRYTIAILFLLALMLFWSPLMPCAIVTAVRYAKRARARALKKTECAHCARERERYAFKRYLDRWSRARLRPVLAFAKAGRE